MATAMAKHADNSMQFLKGEQVMDFPVYDFSVAKQTMAAMLAVYLVMIVVLRKFMQGRTPYSLAVPMKVYNIAQVALNVYMIQGLCVLSSPTNIFGINEKYTARCVWQAMCSSGFMSLVGTSASIPARTRLRGKSAE
jgi:hypothetical protein